MRRIIWLIHASLDGFAAGPNGEMDWIVYDGEVEAYSHELHDSTDAAIYGRVTYQMMESYWPTVMDNPDHTPGDRAHAQWANAATKIVVSRTLENPTWQNTVVIRDNIADEITKLKQQPGKDMWLLGSPGLVQTFIRHDLIDEYRVNVNPVVLGQGKPVFGRPDDLLKLTLLETRLFNNGVVGMRYAPQNR